MRHRCADRAAQLGARRRTAGGRPSISPSMARIWSPIWMPALRGGRAVLDGADQDLLVVGALDGDADAAAAVALEAVVPRLVGVGVAAVAVELLGGGGHRLADERLAVGLLQRGRGVDRAGHQFGQHAAPGAAVRRVGWGVGGSATSWPSRLTVKLPSRGLQDERRIGAGETAIGLGREIAEIGFVEMAVADGAVGLQDDPLDIDVGGERGPRPSAWLPGVSVEVAQETTRAGSNEAAAVRGSVARRKGNQRHFHTQLGTTIAQAVGGRPRLQGERSRLPVEGLGSARSRCAQSSAMTAPFDARQQKQRECDRERQPQQGMQPERRLGCP